MGTWLVWAILPGRIVQARLRTDYIFKKLDLKLNFSLGGKVVNSINIKKTLASTKRTF